MPLQCCLQHGATSSATIINCFSKAFELDGQDLNCNENDSYDLLGDVQVPLNMEMHEFVDAIDFDEEKDFEIEQTIAEEHVDLAGGEDEEEEVPDTAAVSITTNQAMKSLSAIRSWAQENGMSSDIEVVNSLLKLENKIVTIWFEHSKQAKITDFFLN